MRYPTVLYLIDKKQEPTLCTATRGSSNKYISIDIFLIRQAKKINSQIKKHKPTYIYLF